MSDFWLYYLTSGLIMTAICAVSHKPEHDKLAFAAFFFGFVCLPVTAAMCLGWWVGEAFGVEKKK